MLTLVTLQRNRNGINIDTIPVQIVLTLLCMQLSIASFIVPCVHAQDPNSRANTSSQSTTNSTSHPYRTANATIAIQTLNAPCDQIVDRVPLGELLEQLATAYKTELLCDRRVAIDQPISIPDRTKTLRELLEKSADQVHCDIAIFDKLIVLVPSQHRDAIEQSYWNLLALGPNHAINRVDKKVFEWQDGAVAHDVIQTLLERYKLGAVTIPPLPFDVWRARQFRDVTPSALCTYLLGGFELGLEATEAANSNDFTIAKLSDEELPFVEWIYDDDTIKNKIGPKAWQAWREKWPKASVEQLKPQGDNKRKGWRIRTTAASHRDLIEPLIPPKKWETPPGIKKQFSGKFSGRLDDVVMALAQAASLTIAPWPLPDNVARTEINLSIKDATIDAILVDISKQTGFDLKRSGNQIVVQGN